MKIEQGKEYLETIGVNTDHIEPSGKLCNICHEKQTIVVFGYTMNQCGACMIDEADKRGQLQSLEWQDRWQRHEERKKQQALADEDKKRYGHRAG